MRLVSSLYNSTSALKYKKWSLLLCLCSCLKALNASPRVAKQSCALSLSSRNSAKVRAYKLPASCHALSRRAGEDNTEQTQATREPELEQLRTEWPQHPCSWAPDLTACLPSCSPAPHGWGQDHSPSTNCLAGMGSLSHP